MVLIRVVFLIASLHIALADINILLNPGKRCIPSASQVGVCHVCVCTVDGLFHCHAIKCNSLQVDPNLKECSPHYTYRQDTLFCSCDSTGRWRSERCRKRFNQIRPRTSPYLLRIATNIACTPDNFYALDCNICVCSSQGHISLDYCTNRECSRRTKVDHCNPGDMIRTDKDELCACSEINYFIDRLCLKLTDKVIQEVTTKELQAMTGLSKNWADLKVGCTPFYTYTMDCASCDCDRNGTLRCNNLQCAEDKNPRALRVSRARSAFESLPELQSLDDRCTPGVKYRYHCNTCMCSFGYYPVCTTMICLDDVKLTEEDLKKKRPPNVGNPKPNVNKRALPEIREGEPCFPGRLYKLECNTCRCTKDQTLMCTKMACLDWKNLDKKGGKKKVLRNDAAEETSQRDKEPIKKKQNKKSYLPKVQKGMVCKPGKIYRSKCKRCYCTAEKQIICTMKKDACTFDKFGNAPPILTAEDVHPLMQTTEIDVLPELHSASERCQPGKRYKVDCNFCVCMESSNLVCQKKLCVSFEDMNRIQAKEMSGKKCDDAPLAKDCIICTCVGGLTKCNAIPECSARQFLSSNGDPPVDLDPNGETLTCVPFAVYKTDCNKCYCQEDGSLRCTQKTCLNYSQVKLLEEQREYLERHGL